MTSGMRNMRSFFWAGLSSSLTPATVEFVYGVQTPASQPGAHLSPASVSFHLSLVSSFSSVPQSCPTLFDPMNCSMPGFPVHQQLLEVTQTQIHRVSDALHPSHPIIPFSHLQPFPASRSFLMSQLFASGGQSTGASALASVLAVNIQGWFPLELTGLISLQSKGLSRVFSNTTVQKNQFLGSAFFTVQFSYPYMTTGKTIPLTIQTFVGKVMSLFFNMLSSFVIAFLPRNKHLLISWL